MKEEWFDLKKQPLEKTKQFVRALFEADIADKITWFDRLKAPSFARQIDSEMTLDYYLANVTEKVEIRYILGREEFISDLIPAIDLILIEEFDNAENFAWFICPYTVENYRKIDEFFQAIYGISQDDYEVSHIPIYR